jgi:DNA-binding response OmpR family regulator
MATENYGRLKLLFVDDAAHTRLMLREMLRNTQWPQAEFADSAAAAFKQIKANLPDLVITDWQMPGESGLDLIRTIRQHPDSPDRLLPVILLTANGDAEHVIGARKAGAIDFLVKPISMKRIVERVINAVTRPRPFIVSPSYVGPDWRRPAGQPEDPRARPDEPLPAGAVVLPPDGLLLERVRGDATAIREARERRNEANAIVAAAVAATLHALGRVLSPTGPPGAPEVVAKPGAAQPEVAKQS